MSQLARFGVDVILAVVVAVFFVISGVVKLLERSAQGRRAVAPEPRWQLVVRKIRGVLEILGGLAVAASGAITLLGLRIGFPTLALSLFLAGLGAWTVVEAVRQPVRLVRLGLGLLGFALAVFFAGFRE